MTTDLKAIPGGKGHARPPAVEVIEEIQRTLIGKLLRDAAKLPTVLEAMEPGDLSPDQRAILDVLIQQHKQGIPCSLVGLLDDLDRANTLDLAGGAATIHELFEREATAADVGDVARRLKRLALERRVRVLAEQISKGDRDPKTLEQLHEIEGGARSRVRRCTRPGQGGIFRPWA